MVPVVPDKDGITMELIKYGGEAMQEEIFNSTVQIWINEHIPTDR